jgi:hypothetical protein
MRLLGWQSAEFDGRMQCGSVPLGGLRPDEFIFFSSYALAGLTPPFFFFFFLTLLENYGLQLHHLSPHPSRWWQSSSISVRCTWLCSCQCACSGSSTCYYF